MWEIEVSDQFLEWFTDLNMDAAESVTVAVELLAKFGPAMGPPYVDTVKESRHANMKELRPRSSNIRVLFAFDPRRMAILLLGGDKTGQWQSWYREMIPIADDLYDEHLATLRNEGLI